MTERESPLESFFRRRVRLVGGYTIKLVPVEAGIPDRLVLMPGGRMFLVELKAEDGRVSPIQRVWHSRVHTRYGTRVYVLYGRDDVVRWLREVVDDMCVESSPAAEFSRA